MKAFFKKTNNMDWGTHYGRMVMNSLVTGREEREKVKEY